MNGSSLKDQFGDDESGTDDQVTELILDALSANDKVIEIRPAKRSRKMGLRNLLLLGAGAIGLAALVQRSGKPAEIIEDIKEGTADMVHQAAEAIEEGGEAASDRIEEGSERAGEAFQDAGEKAAERTEDAGEAFQDAGEAFQEAGDKAAERTEDAGKKAAERTEEASEEAADEIDEEADEMDDETLAHETDGGTGGSSGA